MACVWLGLIGALNLRQMQPVDLLNHVKANNCQTVDVVWNDQKLSDKAMTENIARINEVDPKQILGGYDCSGCDPLLLLIAQLYGVTIIHKLLNTEIVYKNLNHPDKIIRVYSDHRHFWN